MATVEVPVSSGPAGANPPANAAEASSSDVSDDDDSDAATDTDDDDEENGTDASTAKANYTDAGIQWEATPAGPTITVHGPPMLPVWRQSPIPTSSFPAPLSTANQQPAVSISSLINSPTSSPVNASAGPSMSPAPPTIRILSPLPQAGPRISGSASSPLAGPSFTVAPHLVFPNARRAQTPPLGASQVANHANVGIDTAPSSVTAPKLLAPIPIPKPSPTRFSFDAVMGESSAMDLDP